MAKIIPLLIILLVIFGLIIGISRLFKSDFSNKPVSQALPTKPADPPLGIYSPPKINPSDSYAIELVGDSMTAALGPNCDKLAKYLNEAYPGKVFGFNNYSVPASSLLSLEQRLTQSTDIKERILPPILETDTEIIIIESFAHNPLSEFPLAEGLQKQNEILEKTVKRLIKEKPGSLIVFLATIGPSKTDYAKNSVELSSEVRLQWANERIAYLENHVKFAQNHQIPLINVYEKSKDLMDEVDLKYVNSDDYIHPSAAGIELISREIANYIIENQILPK